MNWFLIALGAPFLWAIVNIFDQYLVKKYSKGEKGSGGLVLFSSLVGIFAAFFIGILTSGLFAISIYDKLLLVLVGGLSISWIIIYLYTIEVEDISFIVPWFSMVPVIGYVLGYLFLGEILTTNQLLGMFIVLVGVILISIDFSVEEKFKFKWKPALYLIIACFIIATIGIIFKYVTISNGSFWISSFWEYLGLGIFGILIYLLVPKYRREFNYMNKLGGKKIFSLNILSELITIVGNLLSRYATLLAPIALVYVIESFQPAIVLLIVIIGTKFFPNIITEKIDRKVLIPKILSIILIVIGGMFLFT